MAATATSSCMALSASQNALLVLKLTASLRPVKGAWRDATHAMRTTRLSASVVKTASSYSTASAVLRVPQAG